jgi:hypothetical protein
MRNSFIDRKKVIRCSATMVDKAQLDPEVSGSLLLRDDLAKSGLTDPAPTIFHFGPQI